MTPSAEDKTLLSLALVDRRSSAATRREISLSLTPVGREVLTRFDQRRIAALRDRVDAVDPARRPELVEALSALFSGDASPVPELPGQAGR